MQLLELEQQKSERLLLNVLPPSIATLLKDNDRTIATYYAEASILFADIADFTELSAALPPGEVVEMLNAVFTKFDQLTENHGLEKIKTIGDSYMVAAGVPETRPDHAEVVADLALDMMAAVRTQTFNGHLLVLRIGINSGPVVAGVIGTHKFSYDLWGDTVNTASRIEQYGLSGEIQVSDATRERIEHRFHIEEREPIEMKGKGLMQAYLLKERKALSFPEKEGLDHSERAEPKPESTDARRSALDSDKWGRWRPLVGVGGADGGPGQRRWGGVGGTACKGRQSRTGPVRLCGVVE